MDKSFVLVVVGVLGGMGIVDGVFDLECKFFGMIIDRYFIGGNNIFFFCCVK